MTASQELLKDETLAKLDAHRERMMAKMDSQLEKREACLEKTKAAEEIKFESNIRKSLKKMLLWKL
jgi:hypothetical protein